MNALGEMGFEDSLLSLYDRLTQRFSVEGVSGSSWKTGLIRLEEDISVNNLLSAVLNSDKPEVMSNPAQAPALSRHLEEGSTPAAQVMLPIRISDELIGTLQVNLTQQERLGEDEEVLLRALCDQLAISISRIRSLRRSIELTDQIMASTRFITAEALSGMAIHSLYHKLDDLQHKLDAELNRKEVRENKLCFEFLHEWQRTFYSLENELGQTLRFIRRAGDEDTGLIDLHLEIIHSKDMWENFFRLNKVAVSLHLEAENCSMMISRDAFREIMSVLFVNSVQAHAKRIVVRTYNKENYSAMPVSHVRAALCLDFIDDGEGLLTNRTEEVFEPTYTTKPSHFGVGLGLFIARRLARQAGGDLFIASPSGEAGATFRLVLPYE
jgi:signal transduction histidine kinase